jgi:hypothetical protein
MLTIREFINAVKPLEGPYRDDCAWFTGWGDHEQFTKHITKAELMYERANKNELGMLLLGDAKIRASKDLLMNFGITTGGEVNDTEKVLAARLADDRLKLASMKKQEMVDVAGPGSILNDKDWTPLLNDAFIMGGVHGKQDFHWAESDFHASSGVEAAKAAQSGPAALKEVWRKYLLKGSNFWAGGYVRVFVRELIGLKTFGYRPVFSHIEIGFEPLTPPIEETFKAYLNALRESGYVANDPAKINAVLGEYLFGDRNALKDLKTKA